MRILLFIAILLSLSSCSLEQKLIKSAKEDIQKLASDDFHGRGYMHQGLEKAESYIAHKFQEIELEPVYPNYRQKVTYPVNIIKSVDLKINGKPQEYGVNYLVGPNSESDNISSTTFHFPDDIFDFSLQDGKETFRILSLNQGKIPVLDFRNATDSLKQNLFAFSDYLDQEKNHYNIPAIIHVHEKLIHGISDHQDNFIHVFLDDLPKEGSEIQLNLAADLETSFTSHNIVGKIKGSKSDKAILIMAHFDHLGQINETVFHGANDNASGVAMLIQLAKYFKSHPIENDVYFYAMTGEEAGLKGAFEAVQHLPVPKEDIRFVINLDILGTGDDGIQVVNSSIYKNEYELLQQINREHKLLKQIKKRGEACNSDHCPFHMAEIPSFFIYTLCGISHYHNPLDKAETLPLTEFYSVYELLTKFIEKL
ncbi:M28 family peptidase [Weeksellaceae bacterium KMM 9724]|uniref:M28 family metallopeptidase n=1 Tax=Profundicola chukchiensis TaxID=2961959 RepID=UPI00243ACB63|nr:M28 family peptidase [Profundicola chukchiensis]MDG4951346.1 M28 family peptidase [Profundicola chukchiensis]